MKHLWRGLFVLVLFFCMGLSVQAEGDSDTDTSGQKEQYEYKVTFRGGLYSKSEEFGEMTVKSGTRLESSDLNVYAGAAVSTDDNYKFSGWHISGIEGKIGSIVINEDTVLVATYSLPGEDVEYTIQYVDAETGEELETSETFYGTAGDDMVVAYKYIDGYLPQTYNLRRKLSATSANIFKFEYRRVTGEEQIETVVVEEQNPNNPNQGANQQGGNQGGQNAGGDEQGNPGGNNQGGETIEDNPTPQTQPSEIEVIPDDPTPQTKPENNLTFWQKLVKSPWSFISLIGGGAALIAFLWWLLFFRRKKKEEDEDDA